MKLKKHLLKSIPYISSIIGGIIFYLISILLENDIKNIFLGISSTLFTIPIIILFYDILKALTDKKLNHKIYDYAKIQVDTVVLSILNQLIKIVYPIEKKEFSFKGITEFLSIKKKTLKTILNENYYFGFQIFKTWEINEKNLHDLLKNTFILDKLSNEQIISMISLIKSIRKLESILKNSNLYVKSIKAINGLKIVKGTDLNKNNTQFPDRYLLLKYLSEDKFIVMDFGDFKKYNLEKLSEVYEIDKNKLDQLHQPIGFLLTDINNWLTNTNNEFLIDTKEFRMNGRK